MTSTPQSTYNVYDDEQPLSTSLGYQLEKIINYLLRRSCADGVHHSVRNTTEQVAKGDQDLAASKQKQFVTIGLSGGSLVQILANTLPYLQLPWPQIRFFFVDERHVPFTSNESTYHAYDQQLFRQLPLTQDHVIKINADLTVEECAKDYEDKLRRLLQESSTNEPSAVQSTNDETFDILLLGMGPDGHTASLFPNHKVLDVDNCLVTYIKDSPKPPQERITLTLTTINKAKHVLIVAMGEAKSQIVKEVIKDKNEQYPIGKIRPAIKTQVRWYLDKQAASQL
ncbi:unnamed protein product [Didymodactylos carnosus]|uniref:6-phosphogluconolactonase n=1 Tax=Didymodactylos carnosus TaxID=1234261 RepID=A0A815KH22_9BILA|nr:unnamed protein product [Didymodactylos carnosus]CAF1391002.1 unnamed protein product [Didymodactylos carnosus]CAF4007346.1 unnamed protein product [Didymodactylos carnosus]CAF4285519.1 unnamed protein product [Didymodactylos carnosus]